MVASARARYDRIRRQHEEERARLPQLAAAVQTGRGLVKEREIQRVLDPTEETALAAQEARELLQRAIEAETSAIHSAETLRIAEERAGAELSAAVEAQAKSEERTALAVLDASAEKDATDLCAVLVRLFLRARLRGLTTHAQALVSATLGLAASGEAMLQKSGELYRHMLKESKP